MNFTKRSPLLFPAPLSSVPINLVLFHSVHTHTAFPISPIHIRDISLSFVFVVSSFTVCFFFSFFLAQKRGSPTHLCWLRFFHENSVNAIFFSHFTSRHVIVSDVVLAFTLATVFVVDFLGRLNPNTHGMQWAEDIYRHAQCTHTHMAKK